MKKSKVVLIVLLVVAVLLVVIWVSPIFIHSFLLNNANEYAHETADDVITNEAYVIKKKVYDEEVTWITFYVEDKEGKVVFSADERWRALDFKGFCFIDGTNDICASSGDVGDTIYKFNGDTWEIDFPENDNILY